MITSFRSIRRLRERCVDAVTASGDDKGGEEKPRDGRVVSVPRVGPSGRERVRARVRRAIGWGLDRARCVRRVVSLISSRCVMVSRCAWGARRMTWLRFYAD